MGDPPQKEWRKGRSALFGALAEGLALGGVAAVILLRLGPPDLFSPSPGYWLVVMAFLGLATVIVRLVPNLLIQVLLFALPVVGLVLLLRSGVSLERETNALAALTLLVWAGFRLLTAWHRVRSPLFLRLGPEGIERGGYALPTPTIPYDEIARVEPYPEKNPKGVLLVLRHRERWWDRLFHAARGYDAKIGADVGARPIELAARIRREIPELPGEVGHSGFLTTFPHPE